MKRNLIELKYRYKYPKDMDPKFKKAFHLFDKDRDFLFTRAHRKNLQFTTRKPFMLFSFIICVMIFIQ